MAAMAQLNFRIDFDFSRLDKAEKQRIRAVGHIPRQAPDRCVLIDCEYITLASRGARFTPIAHRENRAVKDVGHLEILQVPRLVVHIQA